MNARSRFKDIDTTDDATRNLATQSKVDGENEWACTKCSHHSLYVAANDERLVSISCSYQHS